MSTRNLVSAETAERNRRGIPGAYTFNALADPKYAGDTLTFACVRIGDHAHVHVDSGRTIPQEWSFESARSVGFAGKLTLRWPEWLLLRGILDSDPRVRIAEVENPTPGMLRRYAADRPPSLRGM